MLFPTCLTLPSIFRHFALSPFTWAVNSYTTCAPQVVEHSVLTSRILYFQLNRQFISGRHVSFSVHSLYKSLYVLCICTMATASPPNSIQKTEPFRHYLSSNYATQMNWNALLTAGHYMQGFSNFLSWWCYRVQMLHASTLSEACRSDVFLSIMIRLIIH